MTKPSLIAILVIVATLGACSKTAPPPPDSEHGAASAAAVQPEHSRQAMSGAEYSAKLLALIDETPGCQTFRARLVEAGSVAADQAPSDNMERMNQIFAQAYQAGCKRQQP